MPHEGFLLSRAERQGVRGTPGVVDILSAT